MIQVEVLGLDPNGSGQRLYGIISCRNGVLSASSQSKVLEKIMDSPVIVSVDGRTVRIYANTDPEEFLRNLHRQYRSPYLRVTEVRPTDFQQAEDTNGVPNRGDQDPLR